MDDHFLFYVPPEYFVSGQLQFPEEEARHIIKVLRKRVSDVVQVTDGMGNRMEVRLTSVDKKTVSGDVVAGTFEPPGPDRILAMGAIRQRDRLEFAIEKAVELGATRIILVHSDHAEKVRVKESRIEKIIISAMKQSRQCHLPRWEERACFDEVISDYSENRKVLMAHPDSEDDATNKTADVQNRENDRIPQLLLVGPEGGFSGEEVRKASEIGAIRISLGPKRLRAETAVCALLTLTMYR